MMMFVKIFKTEKAARAFAEKVGARVIVRYEWDEICERLIREFVVKY